MEEEKEEEDERLNRMYTHNDSVSDQNPVAECALRLHIQPAVLAFRRHVPAAHGFGCTAVISHHGALLLL